MLALGGAGVSEANGVPPVAGLLDGFDWPFGSAQGPERALRGRGWPFDSAQGPRMEIWGRGWPFGFAQGPERTLRGRKNN